jgi:hypothetical protein
MIVNRVFQSKPPRAAAASTPVGKSRIHGGEEPEDRPVEVGPAPRRHPDKAVVHEACGRHGHRRALGLGESEPQVLDGERHRQSQRAVGQGKPGPSSFSKAETTLAVPAASKAATAVEPPEAAGVGRNLHHG